MAKELWVSATLYDAETVANPAIIRNIIVSSDTITQEDERATIEDNQDVQILLTGSLSFETRNLITDAATPILSDPRINTNGSVKGKIVLTSQSGLTAVLDRVYINARKVILSTEEVGVMIDAKRSDVVSSDPIDYV